MPTKSIGKWVHISDAQNARVLVEAMEKAQERSEREIRDRESRKIMRRAILDSIARIGGRRIM